MGHMSRGGAYWIALLFYLSATSSLTLVAAVDKSKFRTCGQTSFCRRHRGGHSESLYKYRLVKDSIRFVTGGGTAGAGEEDGSAHEGGGGGGQQQDQGGDGASTGAGGESEGKGGGGIWSSLKHLVTTKSKSSSTSTSSTKDPYFRGPTPILTATLLNTVSDTSTSQTEELNLSIHLHDDGVSRVRITERYGGEAGGYYEKARWTSDELILNVDEMVGVSGGSVEMLTSENSEELLTKLITKLGDGKEDLANYLALRYGNKEDKKFVLLLKLDPFAVYMWRDGEFEGMPLVKIGEGGLMHFEIRRGKDETPPAAALEEKQDEKEDKTEEEGAEAAPPPAEKKDEEGEEDPEDDPSRHGGKEIVGYWEDGLAIYADGTREERPVEDEAEARHRQLLEEQAPELDKEGMWDEHFSSHHDTKPYGPMSVGMDINFPQSKHLFGLPEHASSTQLKTTHGEGAHYHDPYRMYNLDVFEYELDETMALYGHVPLLVSHSLEGGTVGVFWFNPTETFVDVEDDKEGMKTHWMSESGIIDLFLLPGPDASKLYEQYAHLTGRMPLPPMFSLGYHQCRWNYKDERDVYQVHGKFEEYDYPYDVLWLDIEHTDGKRYFTWDSNLFPNPKEMQDTLWHQGRRMVTIIDPHIKRDDNYYIHKEATAKGLYIKDKSGTKDYDGWCWPGSSSYLDFTNEKVRSWWADQFSYQRYQGSTPSLFTWNDMNEPSVFNGPEVSMQKDLLNLDHVEHREWHNLYGLLFHQATGEGQIRRNQPFENVRPFVLSRAFFAGSQKYGAIWTGDNEAKWSHLEISSPMLLSLNVGALSFVGADVGGFFGNPDGELMTRWMQAGSYQPFFRGHAHHDAKRREPWLFGEETLERLRRSAMARYALLPYWYTVFREAGVTGMPVMRTMWMQYPQTPRLFSIDDQYLIGSDLLVKPITASGVTQTTVLFPTNDNWYDVDTLAQIRLPGGNNDANPVTLKAGIDKIPVYQRGGSIVPRKLRLRRSTQLMKTDPYTLYVALDGTMKASGMLYMDDEETFDHERKGMFGTARFTVDFNKGGGSSSFIKNVVSLGSGWTDKVEEMLGDRMIERIVIMGLYKPPKEITLVGGGALEFQHDNVGSVLVIRKPGVSALADWEMSIVQK